MLKIILYFTAGVITSCLVIFIYNNLIKTKKINLFNKLPDGDPVKKDKTKINILPYNVCPKCGSNSLIRQSQANDKGIVFFTIKCEKCNWAEWSK